MPLTDAARVLTLHNKIASMNNTFKRFEALAQREPGNRELYEQAADAYEILMRFRTLQGLKQRNSGRFFNPSELSKMERILLRNSFRPIQDLQSLLKTRFQLGFF
jgi:CBS domain-containing protein